MRVVLGLFLSGVLVFALGCGGSTPTPEQKAKSDPTKAVDVMSKMAPKGAQKN
jgi:hypothetical protein